MPTMRDIKQRIKGIRNIQQIARAMKLISTAKLQKAEKAVKASRPYFYLLKDVASNLAMRCDREAHPLLAHRAVKKRDIVLITSNRGLCGAFNLNLIDYTLEFISKGDSSLRLYLIGKKGWIYFRKREFEIASFKPFPDPPTQGAADSFAKDILNSYANSQSDEVLIIYNEFTSIVKQTPTALRLFPIEGKRGEGYITDYIYEPKREDILERFLSHYAKLQLYHTLLESAASEHGARMLAMDNAMKSATEMIDELILSFNKARQQAITQELTEIVTSTEAMASEEK
jgi:F-type H+-transporting ATPase subunit gamma